MSHRDRKTKLARMGIIPDTTKTSGNANSGEKSYTSNKPSNEKSYSSNVPNRDSNTPNRERSYGPPSRDRNYSSSSFSRDRSYSSSRPSYSGNRDSRYERVSDHESLKFPGVLEIAKRGKVTLYTKNLVPGKTVYVEKLISYNGEEYREWMPEKSKLGAAIMKGIPETGITENSTVLYLGAASGTTVSHVSDIVKNGFVFALDFAPRVVRDLVYVAEDRKNIAPILADAKLPETYFHRVLQVDMIFQDIAQKNQSEIFLKNINMFLKKGGTAILAVKARSIDVSKNPALVFAEVRRELEGKVKIIDSRTLEPFEKDHCIIVCKKI